MIVPAMNSEEILNEVLLDKETVLKRADQLACNILKQAYLRPTRKPVIKYYNYKSPRKNDWILIFKNAPLPGGGLILSVHYLNKMGFNCLVIGNESVFHHLSGHFLERFNERFLKQSELSKIEIFKAYITKNILISTNSLDPPELEIKRIIIKVNDGIAFGTKEIVNGCKIFDFRTFISNEMVLDFQKEDVDYIKNNYELYCSENQLTKRIQDV